ncbi:MAG: thioredoxin-dependent thiol peroxidase [Pseudomonadota bacterium]|nr:thioredoxin-dependent thiol peroxidase [Pseudomonadota bacterium]
MQTFPNVTLIDDQDKPWTFKQSNSGYTVFYFYPKAMTSGCTVQCCQYRDHHPEFNELNCTVYGVSKDDVAKLKRFKEKEHINFTLLSDQHTDLCEQLGIWIEKSMYGKKYMGIERTTLLLNHEGQILKIWNKVKYDQDVSNVIATIRALELADGHV